MPNTATIRFNPGEEALRDWLSQFAHTHDMSKVIKLACYMLSGLTPDDGLLALLPEIQQRQAAPAAPPVVPDTVPAQEATQDRFAEIMQELAALREALTQNSAPAEQTQTSANVAPVSDSRRRRKPKQPLRPSSEVASVAPDDLQPVESSGLDMSRRRRAGPPKLLENEAVEGERFEAGKGAFDPKEASRRLLESIRAYK